MCTSPQSINTNHTKPASSAPSWWRIVQAYRLTPLVAIACCYLLVSIVLRVVLAVAFGFNNGMQAADFPAALMIGLVNDSIALCSLLAPLYLLFTFMPERLYRSLAGLVMLAVIGWFAIFSILYLAVIQYYFFKEFSARFNLVAVDYLIYPHEVFINIYQSYHVASTLLIMATYATALLVFFWKWLTHRPSHRVPMKYRVRCTLAYALILVLFSTLFSTHTFDFSSNRITKIGRASCRERV